LKRRASLVFAIVEIAAYSSPSQSRAQAQAEKKPLTLEVSSLRPAKPGAVGVRLPGPLPGGQTYISTNSPLMVMIMTVYRMTDKQILGAPNWMFSDPWDVVAKAEHPSTREQLQEMFQTLIVDRFKLRFHRETKEIFAYVLSVEKSGAKLKRSDAEDPFDIPIKEGERPDVRVGTRVPMSYLSWQLSVSLNAPVVDKTGLDGFYDFTLDRASVPPPLPEEAADPLPGRSRSRGPQNCGAGTAWVEVGVSQDAGGCTRYRSHRAARAELTV
jgi:uncharacterized protein (TIGR03435 family)